jgi:protein SCO1/2
MTRFVTLLMLGSVAACRQTGKAELAGGLMGVPLPTAVPRPSFTLTTVGGASFDFAAATGGRLTLLFFGYTNCPDVCPATMANIGAVTRRLPSADRARFDVVFVTTDPDRDSPERLRAWLARFDPAMIGLTGTVAEVERAQRAAGVGVAVRDSASGSYTVSHAAQVLVYSPDDSGHIAYPFGTRQADWAADLPKLETRWPAR